MRLDRRIQQLELKMKSNSKEHGCDVSLFIVIPGELQQGHFDHDSYRPTDEEVKEYLKHLKESGQCRE